MIVNYYDDFTHKDQFILHAQHYMGTDPDDLTAMTSALSLRRQISEPA